MSFHESRPPKPRKNMSRGRTSDKYCQICGLHKRGAGHEAGQHHKTKSQERKSNGR